MIFIKSSPAGWSVSVSAELKSSIDDLYTTIDLNSNQDYYKIPSEELPKLRDLTDDYWSYIQMLKDSLISLDKNN